jgi:methylated-DNA-[protein]-cysteine S-methyltransferase
MTFSTGDLVETPLGPIAVAASPAGVEFVWFGTKVNLDAYLASRFGAKPDTEEKSLVDQALTEIDAYLNGKLQDFHLPIAWGKMNAFERQARELCYAIPYGQTRTYGELAVKTGDIKNARAVGTAMASNPMPLIIPCHRVIGSDGRLHGYAGPHGIKTKAWLLHLEGALLTDFGM